MEQASKLCPKPNQDVSWQPSSTEAQSIRKSDRATVGWSKQSSTLGKRIESRCADEDHDCPTSVVVVNVHLSDGRSRVVAAPIHPPGPPDIGPHWFGSCKGQLEPRAPGAEIRKQAHRRLPRSHRRLPREDLVKFACHS